MKDIEKVILELTPYEAALVRHALIELLGATHVAYDYFRQTFNNGFLTKDVGKALKEIRNIEEALDSAGIRYLTEDEIEQGRIIHY